MKGPDHEARRERRDRERQAGEAFQKMLRERVEGPGLGLRDLMGRDAPPETTGEGGDDAA